MPGRGSCCELVLVGESVEDRSAADMAVGQVDHVRGLGFGLEWGELSECAVWPRVVKIGCR